MRIPLLCLAVALGLYACSREEPAIGQPKSQTRIDETRAVEKASDAGKPLSDDSLTQIVRSALESESSLDARKIDVENSHGNVALHGSVDSEEQREKAGRIAGAVGGVRNVANNITVDSASTGASTPEKSPSSLKEPLRSGDGSPARSPVQ